MNNKIINKNKEILLIFLLSKSDSTISKKNDNPATNNWQKKVADSKTVIPKSGCMSIKDKSKKKKTNSKGK